MILKNYNRNKCSSEPSAAKNISNSSGSSVSECGVKKLIEKYEDLYVVTKNKNIRRIERSTSETLFRNSAMLSDISLNKNVVHKFLSLDDTHETRNNNNLFSESNNKEKCDMSHRVKPRIKKSNFKVSELGHDNEHSSLLSSRASKCKSEQNYKYHEFDINKTQDHRNSLSNRKSIGKYIFRSSSVTPSKDEKSQNKQLQDKKADLLTKDSACSANTTYVPTLQTHSNTGAIKKQLNSDDILYRKRRKSYLLATQNDDNYRKLENEKGDKSYVNKTVSKYENNNKIVSVVDLKSQDSQNKYQQNIKQLLEQYHNDKKVNRKNRMSREKLHLEIDNVLQNKFKHISNDKPQEMGKGSSGKQDHSNLQTVISDSKHSEDIFSAESEPNEVVTVVVHQNEENIPQIPVPNENIPDYLIIIRDNASISEISNHSDNKNENEQNVTELNSNYSKSLESNFCESSEVKKSDSSIADIYLQTMSLVKEMNNLCDKDSDENEQDVSENRNDLIENVTKRKVSTLVNYFSDLITENNKISVSSQQALENHAVPCSEDFYEDVFEAAAEEMKDSSSESPKFYISLTNYSHQVFEDKINEEKIKDMIVSPSEPLGKNNIENSTSIVDNVKPRLSRLYSGKFRRSYSSQDANNNDYEINKTEEISAKHEDVFKNNSYEEITINNEVQTNDEFCSDSDEGEYVLLETINYYPRSTSMIEWSENTHNEYNINMDKSDEILKEEKEEETNEEYYSDSNEREYLVLETKNSLSKSMLVTEWVKNSLKQYDSKDFQEKNIEDIGYISEKAESVESSENVYTIYDEENNPMIRMSMLNINEEYNNEEINAQINESEKELSKNIKIIQDNSKKACIINELITTEKNYVYISLHRLVHDYMPEIRKDYIPNSLIGKERQIFGNADIIYENHRYKFLPNLQMCSCVDDIAQCFLNHEALFKLYPLYSKNKPKSDIILRDWGFYFQIKQEQLNDKLGLASYLLTPIQRLAKYCLLLGSLVRECDKENVPCDQLKAALEMLSKQMKMSNDLIALDAIVGFDGNIRDQGDLLLRETFLVVGPNKKYFESMVFLFQESLFITAIQRLDGRENFIYKESFALTDMGLTSNDADSFTFSVWYRKREVKMYTLRTKYPEIKQKWIKEVFDLLWKQLEASKRRSKQELLENGITDTRVPLAKLYSVPTKQESNASVSSTRSKKRKNVSYESTWYASNR